MRLLILTGGSRGDVQPYVALAQGLQARGHTVTIATFESLAALVTGRGVGHAAVRNPMSAVRTTAAWQAWKQSGSSPIRYVYHFSRVARLARATLEDMFGDFWDVCSGCDAIIGSPACIVGSQIAAALDVPFCWASLQPMSRTIAFPHFLSPQGFRFGGRANRMSYLVAEEIFWRLFRHPVNGWRQRVLKQPALKHPGSYQLPGGSRYPVLYGFSPSVIQPPRDWDEATHVTGYWFLKQPAAWEPPRALSDFLNAGPPPVYVGLAGINAADSGRLLRLTIDALMKARVRGLLQVSGSAGIPDDLPESMLRIGAVPHDWLFERVSAVIHHGGAGTTAAALRAGVPGMAVPAFFDQPFWGRRIAGLGVGLSPIPPGKLSAATLASVFRTLTGDRSIRARAADLGRQIRSEDGVGRAVSLLDRYLGQRES